METADPESHTPSQVLSHLLMAAGRKQAHNPVRAAGMLGLSVEDVAMVADCALDSMQMQAYLAGTDEILMRAELAFSGMERAVSWYLNEPQVLLEGKTASQAVALGRYSEVRRLAESYMPGFQR